MRAQDPARPALHIAQAVGVSRERVRQILKRAQLPTRVPLKTSRVDRVCSHCSAPLQRRPSRNFQYVFCNRQCYSAAGCATLTCWTCKRPFTRQKSDVTAQSHDQRYSGKVFCGRTCYNLYIGGPDSPIAGDRNYHHKNTAQGA